MANDLKKLCLSLNQDKMKKMPWESTRVNEMRADKLDARLAAGTKPHLLSSHKKESFPSIKLHWEPVFCPSLEISTILQVDRRGTTHDLGTKF